tara:strand:+ start:1104 stop:1274 length:171 start_codon:yes stop_codon:yes gene_type:complete
MKAIKSDKKTVKTKPSNDEVLESLRAQFEHHKTMMIKSQGAIEVLEQMNNGEIQEK